MGLNRQPFHEHVYALVAMGTGVAYLLQRHRHSLPQVFHPRFELWVIIRTFISRAAAAITTLVLLGQVLGLRARSQTSSAIRVARPQPENGTRGSAGMALKMTFLSIR